MIAWLKVAAGLITIAFGAVASGLFVLPAAFFILSLGLMLKGMGWLNDAITGTTPEQRMVEKVIRESQEEGA